MKIVYLTPSICNYGGMERVLANKLNWFVEKFGYNILVITTEDKEGDLPFYRFSSKIKVYNSQINYREASDCNPLLKKIKIWKKRKIHKIKVEKILREVKPDICVSTLMDEFSFFNDLNDGSIKIGEIHFSKNFLINNMIGMNEGFIRRWNARYQTYIIEKKVRKLDKFIVLTRQDYDLWSYKENIEVINNPLSFKAKGEATLKNKKIISIGRLVTQKGYDMLIEAWKRVEEEIEDWHLEIYGDGDEYKKLMKKIKSYKLKNIRILSPTTKIMERYLESSIYVMTSRYEGFGMVLLEAMSCSLPLVAFDCESGPRELIKDNGYLVKLGDIKELAEKIIDLIENEELRKKMGESSKEISLNFSPEIIMMKWRKLFERYKR